MIRHLKFGAIVTLLADGPTPRSKSADLDVAAIDRRLENLNRALSGARAAVPAELIATMPLNEKDRHVLALAVHVGAPTIVTENLRDFPTEMLEPFGVEAVSADAFALAQVDLHPGGVRASNASAFHPKRRVPSHTESVTGDRARTLRTVTSATVSRRDNYVRRLVRVRHEFRAASLEAGE